MIAAWRRSVVGMSDNLARRPLSADRTTALLEVVRADRTALATQRLERGVVELAMVVLLIHSVPCFRADASNLAAVTDRADDPEPQEDDRLCGSQHPETVSQGLLGWIPRYENPGGAEE